MKRFKSFEEFYKCLSIYLSNDNIKPYLDRYLPFWYECDGFFYLSFRSRTSYLDPHFVCVVMEYFPYACSSDILYSGHSFILSLKYEKV